MKKILLIALLSVMLLSGCGGRRQSKENCLYCNTTPAYEYEIDGTKMTLCEACYEKEMQQNIQVKEDMKN